MKRMVVSSKKDKDSILAMANVGDIHYSGKTYVISVNGADSEGPIPHFHIKDKTGKRNDLDICICIDKADYLDHHKRTMAKNKGNLREFNGSFKKELNSFMHEKCFLGNMTNWEFIRDYWNHDSNNPMPDDVQQPDYRNLPPLK